MVKAYNKRGYIRLGEAIAALRMLGMNVNPDKIQAVDVEREVGVKVYSYLIHIFLDTLEVSIGYETRYNSYERKYELYWVARVDPLFGYCYG